LLLAADMLNKTLISCGKLVVMRLVDGYVINGRNEIAHDAVHTIDVA
jgi:hypothetical protein